MSARRDWVRARIRQLWKDRDVTISIIGERCGISKFRVSHLARELGLPRRRPGRAGYRKKHDPEIAKSLRRRNRTIREIAIEMRTSPSHVRRLLGTRLDSPLASVVPRPPGVALEPQ